MAKKNVTIDDLAVMVQKGFNGVDKRFDEMATKTEMNARFDVVSKRFDKVEARLGKIENLLSNDYKKCLKKQKKTKKS